MQYNKIIQEKKEEKNYIKNNNEGINSIKNEINNIYDPPPNKELLNTEERKEEKNEDMHQTEEGKIMEGNNDNNYNNNIENEENDMNKNLFNDNSYDDKDNNGRDRNRNKNEEEKNKKNDNVVCRCNIF